MSTILGINYSSHDTAVSLIKDGEILAIFEDEKLRGVKSCYMNYSDPELCLKQIEEKYGYTIENVDHIALASFYYKDFVKKNIGRIRGTIHEVSHHLSHTLGAYFTSGMEGKVLSISHDGKGNRSRGKILLCEDGKYEVVHSQHIPTTASIAGLWASTTNYLGWRMLKDEGKVVGLAAHGKYNERFYKLFKECLYYDGNLNFKPSNFEAKFHYICSNIYEPEGVFENKQLRADFAYCLELVTEEVMGEFLKDVKSRYPQYNKLCLSGGLFANVKLNMFINELGIFDEVFIHPAMGDTGLAVGAAIKISNDNNEIKKPLRLRNVFLGESHNKKEWDKIINENNDDIIVDEMSYDKVGKLIDDGNVVGVFIGRTEYGPRALGNRSIVVKPTDRDTHERLNQKLRRTEIMPFAPSVLEEFAEDIFDIKQSSYTAEFMTICYNTKKEWLEKIPAVVHHVDGTARPQIVNKKRNPNFHNIISAYEKYSGIPLVLNTSLNAHGEPINNYPHQVIKHLLDDSVDYIVTEDYILKKR